MALQDKTFRRMAISAVAAVSIVMIATECFLADGLLSVDGYRYLVFAQDAFDNGWTEAFRKDPEMLQYPPLLIMLMVAGGHCGMDILLTGRLLNILSVFFANQILLFCCLDLYRSRVTALITALLVCALPKIYFEGCGILRDPLYWLQELWIMYLLLKLVRNNEHPIPGKKWGYLVGLAILSAASCLTRKEGVMLTGMVFAAVVVLSFRSSVFCGYRIFPGLLYVVVTIGLIFLPYLCGIPFVPLNFLFMNS